VPLLYGDLWIGARTINRTAWLWLGLAFAGIVARLACARWSHSSSFAGWSGLRANINIFPGQSYLRVGCFIAGLFLFAWALNRTGNYGHTPLDILVNWTKEVVAWTRFRQNANQAGCKNFLQQITNMAFIVCAIYGMLQPVLPRHL